MFCRKVKLVGVNPDPEPTATASETSQEVLEELVEARESENTKVSENITQAQRHQKKNYDLRNIGAETFAKDTLALLKNVSKIRRFGGKLDPMWVELYRVVEDRGKGHVKLQNVDSGKVLSNIYHCANLKLYTAAEVTDQPTNVQPSPERLPSLKIRSTISGLKSMKKPRRNHLLPKLIHENHPNELFNPISREKFQQLLGFRSITNQSTVQTVPLAD